MSDIVEVMARAIAEASDEYTNLWRLYEKQAEIALAALDAAGFAIVPKEPTEAMLQAALNAYDKPARDFDNDDWRAQYVADYRAMLAALKAEAP